MVIQDRRGSFWLATNGGGLDRFDPATARFTHYRHNPADPGSLSHDELRAVYEDRAGIIWVGTYGGGLDRLDPATGGFVHFRHDPTNPRSISNNYVRVVYDGLVRLARPQPRCPPRGRWVGADIFDPEARDAIIKHSFGIPRLINILCDSALVYGYADDVKMIGRELIDTVAQARNLGERGDSQDSIPDEEEKIIEAATSDSLALLRQELEGRFKMLEEKIASQEVRILNISKALESRQGQRDERDEIIIKLFRMMKKDLKRQANMLTARLQEQNNSLSTMVSREKANKIQPLTLLQPKKQDPDPEH